MELSLDIFIWVGRNGLTNLYNKGICELDYNGFRYKANDENDNRWRIKEFPIWDIIQIESVGEILIDNEEFCDVKIVSGSYEHFCIGKKDIDKLKDFCEKRNQEMLLEKKSVCTYVDENILDMAENLLNIIEEDILLDYRVVAYIHIGYSHIESKIF